MSEPGVLDPQTAVLTDAVVIIGSGASAVSAYEIVAAADAESETGRFAGFLDDAGGAGSYPVDAPVGCIGPVRTLSTLDHHTRFVIATDTPASRRIIASWASSRGRTALGAAHPSARFDPGAVGPGYLFAAGTRVDGAAVLGEHVQLGPDVTIGAATLGAFVTVGAGSEVGDGADLGDEVVLGRGVRIAPGVQIGSRSVVRDGAQVLADVAPDSRVMSSVG